MATVEVQEAARKVLLENRRLRALLSEKGVPTAEVEAFLRGYDCNASFTASLPTPEPVDTQSQAAPSEDFQQTLEIYASDVANQSVSAIPPPSTPVGIGLDIASQDGANGQCARSPHETELLQRGERSEKDLGREAPSPNLGQVSDCYCPEFEPVPSQDHASETECSVAANILAGFRGHGDVEQARAELGCPDNARCSVTNAALLNILDSDHADDIQLRNSNAMATR